MFKILFMVGFILICCPCGFIGGLVPIPPSEESLLRQPTPTEVVNQQSPVRVAPKVPTPAAAPFDDLKRPNLDADDSYSGRPALSGSPETLDTANFRIHYTRSGSDAIPLEDSNADGIPDYAESVGKAMEYVRQMQVAQLGWAAHQPTATWVAMIVTMFTWKIFLTTAPPDTPMAAGPKPLLVTIPTATLQKPVPRTLFYRWITTTPK